jgi:high-affinity Fe2+/Pb2+ permease
MHVNLASVLLGWRNSLHTTISVLTALIILVTAICWLYFRFIAARGMSACMMTTSELQLPCWQVADATVFIKLLLSRH